MVYFIATYSTPVLFKVGYSGGSVAKRLKSIQTGCPYELYIYATIPGDMRTEKEIHKKFCEYKTRGEWFNVSLSAVDNVLIEYGGKSPPIWKEVYDGKTHKLLAQVRESDGAVFIPVKNLPKTAAMIYMHTSSHEVIGFHGEGYFIDLRELEKDWPNLREHFAQWRRQISRQECMSPPQSANFDSREGA